MNFDVFILESPSAADLTAGRTEGKLLMELLQLLGCGCFYNHIQSVSDLELAATKFKQQGELAVVHVSAHGSAEGIGLAGNQLIDWQTFFHHFGTPRAEFYSFSSCSAFEGDRLTAAAKELPSPPMMFGYQDQPFFHHAALGTLALLECLVGLLPRAMVKSEECSLQDIACEPVQVAAMLAGLYIGHGLNLKSAVPPPKNNPMADYSVLDGKFVACGMLHQYGSSIDPSRSIHMPLLNEVLRLRFGEFFTNDQKVTGAVSAN